MGLHDKLPVKRTSSLAVTDANGLGIKVMHPARSVNNTKGKAVRKNRVKKRKPHGSGNNGGPTVLIIGSICAVFFVSVYVLGFVRTIQSLPDGKTAPSHHGMNAFAGGLVAEELAIMDDNHELTSKKKLDKTKRKQKKKRDADDTKKDPHGDNKGPVPESKWPVSIRNEDGNFEEIVHPADGKTIITVPKFWSAPVGDGELMTPELASSIGSYTHGGTDADSKNKGSVDERTIFIAIASFRDFQCRHTVESIFTRAKFPSRVRIAIVDQITDGDDSCGVPLRSCQDDPEQGMCKHKDNLDVVELDATLAIGPVFARHIGHRLYRGEYYAMQIDAHVTFIQDWDVIIIDQMEATHNDMAVLSTYLSDITGSISETGTSLRHTRPIMCNTDYEGGQQGKHLRHMSQPERNSPIKGSPQMQPYWAAGFSFSRGHFIVNIPYDLYLPMIFQGEEISVGIRGFTYGYDHYAPETSICFHTYANGPNAKKRNKVHHFWDNADLYGGVGIKAMKRLLGIIGMNPEIDKTEWSHVEEKRYGVGKVRDVTQFFDTFGIDVVKKKVQQNLCSFVQGGKMHHQFLKHLRPNGMGIDYSQIDYKFKDPHINNW